jgi:hypothetical protein
MTALGAATLDRKRRKNYSIYLYNRSVCFVPFLFERPVKDPSLATQYVGRSYGRALA